MTQYLDWEVGDFVVCISRSENVEGTYKEKIPELGKVYQIRNFFISKNDYVCVRVEEILNPVIAYHGYDHPIECGFRAVYFRKLLPNRIEIFTEMLNKTKDKINA